MTTADSTDERYVGDYRLLTVIGEGGMGVVHLAQRVDRPDAPRVALKVLRPHIVGDEEARQRLAQEVGSLRRITSPRIAEILDADPFGPVPFVATRYVPGLSLHQQVRDHGPLGEDDLVVLAAGLAEALLAVHRVGVLHRDVKPSNVLMEGRNPVLIDFGLARLAEDPRLTATGFLLGTPGYLAPEILYGDDPTPAADVHAWAATVVFAATGRTPYGRGPAMAIMDRARHGESDLTGVPESLRPMLHAALAPVPWERPVLADLHADLRRRLDRRPGPPPSPRPAAPVEEWTMPVALAHSREADPPTEPVEQVEQVEPTTRRIALADDGAAAEPDARDDRPWPDDDPLLRPGPPRPGQRRLALAGIGLFGAALVGYAPYLGGAVLALVAALLRLASITAQRHARRQRVRGRQRWYDVPASTLGLPLYLALSLVGTVLLLGWSVLVAIAVGFIERLFGVPFVAGALVVGAAYVLALWWGPGSSRVREMGRRVTRPLGGESSAGVVAFGIALAGAVALAATLAGSGANWAPRPGSPWDHGWLHGVVHAL
ncbi:MAG TPA: serine/threonine-protein kinase [Marmoricola sp.]|nr:serine/threonine-protein kinase [Marmoricola sp.]